MSKPNNSVAILGGTERPQRFRLERQQPMSDETARGKLVNGDNVLGRQHEIFDRLSDLLGIHYSFDIEKLQERLPHVIVGFEKNSRVRCRRRAALCSNRRGTNFRSSTRQRGGSKT